MEKIIIQILEEYYSKDSDIYNLLNYIQGKTPEKRQYITYKNTNGLHRGHKKAAEQIIRTQTFYNKHNQKRRLYHMIVSFPSHYPCSDPFLADVADSIGQGYLQYYQTFYAIHHDTNNPHIHIAINAVGYKAGKKWHKSKQELKQLRQDILDIVNRLHLTYFPNEPYALCL